MLEGKGFMDKLRREAGLFKGYMREKRYPEAKYCYDSVLAALVLMEADRETMREFFGERGERGVILKEGLFPEWQVQEAYLACIRSGDTYENKGYRPLENQPGIGGDGYERGG